MSYKSPIEIIMDDIRKQTIIQEENNVLRAVWRSGVNVDKEELIKALEYDRHQYEKGYWDAKEELFERINTLERENDVLKSALDKACERLSEYSIITLCGEDFCYRTAEEYREWAMNDETD